ncbi:hypothetical protein AWZ03_012060 [Drosophila navojoa]|uniref:Uncharacterized protein n=1 Tax=Drosophila navojoa TaxID=7232 RepID=A0A484B112_DRONA|nr:hypothetical protein AWZ03_012060 [Drosophila navojoa]
MHGFVGGSVKCAHSFHDSRGCRVVVSPRSLARCAPSPTCPMSSSSVPWRSSCGSSCVQLLWLFAFVSRQIANDKP